jgi:hypothetical protein
LKVAMKMVCLWFSIVFPCHSSFRIVPYSYVTTPWGNHKHWADSALSHCYFIKVEVLSISWHLTDYRVRKLS